MDDQEVLHKMMGDIEMITKTLDGEEGTVVSCVCIIANMVGVLAAIAIEHES